MRNYDASTAAYISERTSADFQILYWFKPKNRDTGLVEPVGLWTGDDHKDFTIEGETRTYYGAGAITGLEELTYEEGLSVRTHRIPVNMLAPEVENLLRGYDLRLAPIQIHRAAFHPETGQRIAEPTRIFTGSVDGSPVTIPPKGGTVKAEIAVVGGARALTIPLSLLKSDATLRQRDDTDGFFKYIDVSAQVDVWWGEKRISSSSTAVTPATDTREH